MDLLNTFANPWITVVTTLIVIYGLPYIISFRTLIRVLLKLFSKKENESEKTYKDNIVYLHIFPRYCTKQLLNLSPFAVKLESWLRLKSIPYEVIETLSFSKSTRQIPYIKYNGQEVADTDFIIPYLMNVFKLDSTEGLDLTLQGTRQAFMALVDYRLSWSYIMFRYYFWPEEFLKYFRVYNSRFITGRLLKMNGQGVCKKSSLGRHPAENVGKMGQNDVRAISQYLGDKSYFFGSEPSLVDCALFGHLSQCLLPDMKFPHKEVMQNDGKNLIDYLERFKSRVWPDWNQIVDENCFN